MKVLIITSSPNTDGLTSTCGKAARQGAVDSRSKTRIINLNELQINRCAVHNDGWGTCRNEHRCQLQDDFQELQQTIDKAEGCVFITPVYFGEPSEPMKALFDRLRRCEAHKEGNDSVFSGKPVVCVAAAGGTGHGAIACLAMMEEFMLCLHADVFDTIAVTRKTRDYQVETIHDALTKMTAVPSVPELSPAKRRERQPSRRRKRR